MPTLDAPRELFTPDRYRAWSAAQKLAFLESLIRSEYEQCFPRHPFQGDWQEAVQWMSAAPREPIGRLRASMAEALAALDEGKIELAQKVLRSGLGLGVE